MRIMIVDDHEGVRQLIRQFVAATDDIVCECASGDEAIRLASEFRPDAVTMDVRMPGSCGLKAARAIRAIHPPARVVIVTSHDQPDLGRAAAEAGAAGFVLKDNLAQLNELLRVSAASPTRLQARQGPPTHPSLGNVSPSAPSKALLVLMVEDSTADCELITHQLETRGYKPIVKRVCASEELTRALETGRWDVVLTEYELPALSGMAVVETVRRMNLSIPVVCVTGDFSQQNVRNVLQAGAAACIDKNDPAALGDVVKRAISTPLVALEMESDQNPKAAELPAGPARKAVSGADETPAEMRLRARIAELEAEKKDLKAFACSIAHDLHAPLRAVRAAVATLQGQGAAGNAASSQSPLRRIDEGCRQLSDRIDALMRLARLEQRPLQFQKVCMNAVLEDALSEACSDEERARVELRIAPLPDVWGDRTLLQLAFANLLSNAFKFTARQERPVIEVGSVAGKSEVTFFIKDNGTGFDMRCASRLFQPFGRLHSAEEFVGLGLGLATTRRIVQRHQGRLATESAITHGATFYCTLPTVPPTEGQP